jgi:hypothetical protein
MFRTLTIAVASAAVLLLSPVALAQQTGGTAEEAKAMLMKAVAAVKTDKDKAIALFNKGELWFRDRDLYVFCSDLKTGMAIASGNPNTQKQTTGVPTKDIKDPTGFALGAALLEGELKPEGTITEIHYVWPRPGADKTPVPKVALVERASDDIGCGVGYYK